MMTTSPRLAFLGPENLPEDVYIGHLMEISGSIPHDTELSDSYANELSRWHLRIAEAFAAGLKVGRSTRSEASS